MKCPVCMGDNPAGATACNSCGTPLSGAGIATGHTGGGTTGYTPFLTKGIRLHNGTYAIGEVLGQGGFGITYKGGDLNLRRYVAIKELFPSGCSRKVNTVMSDGATSPAEYAAIKEKFLEEARTLARFSHPSIVRVFSVFEENNTAYMVMEFLEGSTLSRLIQDKGKLGEDEALPIIERIAEALGTIHAANLIHRDLKPDNICLTNDGRAVLIDFGTARGYASGKTVRQTMLLTPGYAPLEQYGQQARFGTYTDVYALGATLYHCLTGEIPVQATDRAAGVAMKAPHEINPNVSRRVSDAVVRAMQLKADQRPANMSEFVASLKTVGAPAAVTPASPATVAAPSAWSSPSGAVDLQKPAPAAAPAPAAGGGGAMVQYLTEYQIATNAAADKVMQAVYQGYLNSGVTGATVDQPGYRVQGTYNTQWGGQYVMAAVTQDQRGIVVTVQAMNSAGVSDPHQSRPAILAVIPAIYAELQKLPPAPGAHPATGSGWGSQQPSPVPNPYGHSPYAQPMQRPVASGQGTTVLIMAIVGVCLCQILAPITWYMANKTLAEYGDQDPGDKSTVVVARVIAIVGTVLFAFFVTINILAMIGAAASH